MQAFNEVLLDIFMWFDKMIDALFKTRFPFLNISWGVFLLGMLILDLVVDFIVAYYWHKAGKGGSP